MKLNADIGEGFGEDIELLTVIQQANIGLGEHAGNWDITLKTAQLSRDAGVEIGLHPGFPDRESMGRRVPSLEDSQEWIESLVEQCRRGESAIPDAKYIKPHGAAYSFLSVHHDEFVQCIRDIGLPLMGIPGSGIEAIASEAGVRFIREGFVERGYLPEFRGLIPRGEPGAELEEINQMVSQFQQLSKLGVETFCIHGDCPGAGKLAREVRIVCEEMGFEFC